MIINRLWDLILNRVFLTLFLIFVLLISGIFICPLIIRGIKGWHRDHFGISPGIYLGNLEISRYYLVEVEELLLKEAVNLVHWPIPAQIDNSEVIKEEVLGQILDISATLESVKEAEAGERLELVLAELSPAITAQEILKLTNPLGLYQTFIQGTEARRHNIKLAGRTINFTLLMPGETFSFNQIVGEPTATKGYKEASIILRDEVVLGYGGGICQVSSTLYNAVLDAGLVVKERNTHSQEVDYVPAGQDAAVAYDYFDFQFINSQNSPLLIKVSTKERDLRIGLYGF